MSKVITLKNHHLNLIKKVMSYPMKFQKGRIRNRFLGIIDEKWNEMEKSRMEIVESFCEKDADGKSVVEQNVFKILPEKRAGFDKEFLALLNENVMIDVLPSWERDLGEIKQIIIDSNVELEEVETLYLEEALEAIKNFKTVSADTSEKVAKNPSV